MTPDIPPVKYTDREPPRDAPQYEFNNDQNALFSRLAHRMNVVGLVALMVGLLTWGVAIWVIAATQGRLGGQEVFALALGNGINGLFYLLVGVWTRRAAGYFDTIPKTRGRDIINLMDALGTLNKVYGLLYFLIMLVVIGVLIVLGLVLASGAVVQR